MDRTWALPRYGDYPRLRSHARKATTSILATKPAAARKAGLELEWFLTLNGELVNRVSELCKLDGQAACELEMNRAGGENATDPTDVGPGLYWHQRDQLHARLARVRQLAARLDPSYRVLVATAGMASRTIPRWQWDATVDPASYGCITPKPRFYAMIYNAGGQFHSEGRLPTLPSGMELIPLYGGLAASLQPNLSFPVNEIAYWRRAAIAIAPLSLALTSGSPLLMGQHTGLLAHRRVSFPGSYYGLDEHGWPRHYRLAPGGHLDNVDGEEAVVDAVLAQLDPERPFLANPPQDMDEDELLTWAEKSAYCDIRMRVAPPLGDEPAHVRIELRWLCAWPTVVDNVANLYGVVNLMQAFVQHHGDGSVIPIDVAEQNMRHVVRDGLSAVIRFPDARGALKEQRVQSVLATLLPIGLQWHTERGFLPGEINELHDILLRRIRKNCTFSTVQLGWHRAAASSHDLYSRIEAWGRSERPVVAWPATWDDALTV